MKIRLILVLFFASLVNLLLGQSSDNVKYYLLYDISGSVAQIDKQEHLRKMFYRTINEVEGKINNSPSFEIIFFGQDTSVLNTLSFDLYKLTNELEYSRQVRSVLTEFKSQTAKTKFNRFTYLDAALKGVKDDANGVFIFSDGQILKGDIDSSVVRMNVEQYILSVRNRINSFEEKNVPVFFIQSNSKPISSFWERELPVVSNDSTWFAKNQKYFWISNVAPDLTLAFSSFDQFLAAAHQQILSANEPVSILNRQVPNPGDVVETMVDINEFSKNVKYLERFKVEVASLNSNDPRIKLIDSVLMVRRLLSGNHICIDSVYKLKAVIDGLSHRNKELMSILNHLRSNNRKDKFYIVPENQMGLLNESTKVGEITKEQLPYDFEKAIVQGLADYVINRTKEEAIYFLFEDMNEKGLLSSTFIRDTLLFNTFNFLSNLTVQPDLLLIKEAFNRDIDNLHINLIKSKRIGKSESLVALVYAYELIRNISREGQLEKAFVNLNELTKSGRLQGVARHVERGVIITSYLIQSLENRDLLSPYTEPDNKYFDELSKMLLTYFSLDRPDFVCISLEDVTAKVRDVYFEYKVIKQQIEELKTLINNHPSSGITEYRQYRRDILLDILDRSTDLIITGVEFSSYFLRKGESRDELINQIAIAKRSASVAIESWFLIRDKDYVKAMMLLIPSILEVVDSSPYLGKFEGVQFNLLVDSVSCQKEGLNKLNKQVIVWKLELMKELRRKLDNDQSVINTLDSLNSARILDINNYNNELAKIGFPELTALIKKKPDGYYIDNKNVTQVKAFLNKVITGENKWNSIKLQKLARSNFALEDYEFPSIFALNFMQFPDIGENFKRMILIGGEVSSAKEASDITNVLTKYALPTTSYRVKRDKKFSIFINAYSGIGSSYFVKSDTMSVVISAPLGFEFSRRWKNTGKSISVLLSPIDVGNVINYQVLGNKPESEEDPFKFDNIYSPAAFLVLGLSKKHPFSFGAGYQWNDNRISVFLGFDLPIFRLK